MNEKKEIVESESKDAIKEEPKPITKEDLQQFSDSLKVAFNEINTRLIKVEEIKQQPTQPLQQSVSTGWDEQPTTQPTSQSKITPEALSLLAQFLKPEESGGYGTSENKTFFAEVGKSDFDAFRLMQQRRLMKLLEKVDLKT